MAVQTASLRLSEPGAFDTDRSGVPIRLSRHEIEDVLTLDEVRPELELSIEDREAEAAAQTLTLAWDRDELARLLEQSTGDEIVLIADGDALRTTLDAEVEAHGLRHAAAVVGCVLATAGLAGTAQARIDQGTGGPAAAPPAAVMVHDLQQPRPIAATPTTFVHDTQDPRPINVTPSPNFVHDTPDARPIEPAPTTTFVHDTPDPRPITATPTTTFVHDTPEARPIEPAPTTTFVHDTPEARPIAPAQPVAGPSDSPGPSPTELAAIGGAAAALAVTAAGFTATRRRRPTAT
jgi:hypothetical protein